MNRAVYVIACLCGLSISCKHQKVDPNPDVELAIGEYPRTYSQDSITVNGSEETREAAVLSAAARSIKAQLEVFAADSLNGRKTGERGFDQAADYLIGELKKYGLDPYYTDFKAELEGFDFPVYNIMAQIPGTHPDLKDQWIVIGAHLDHIGTIAQVGGDSIANGANDNAAGSVIALQLAQRLARLRMANARSLLFVWFTAEESGLVGSRRLAKNLRDEGLSPYLMLNFEMLGVPMNDKDYKVYMTGYNKSNLAEVCNEVAGEKLVGYLPKAQEYMLFKRSDNLGFYEQFSIPAHTFSSFDFTNYDYYHHVDDEAGLLDYEFMAEMVASFQPIIRRLANEPDQVVKLQPE